MPALRQLIRAFNGGEVAPSMFGRIDDGNYQTGLAQCRNFLVEPQGPVRFRPGFQYVNSVKDPTKPPRLIPFTFSSDQTMVLEFGEKYVRFHTQGQTLMGTNGQPYEVETPYLADEVMSIHYVQSADVLTLVHPNHMPMELRRYSSTDWRLVQVAFQPALSSPGAPSVSQTINNSVSNKTDYVREYAVTALNDNGEESAASSMTSIACNPYGDGAYNTISWSAVDGATRYRVYRNEGGILSYIGQTTGTSIRDENISADSSITPPIYDAPFSQEGGITQVNVLAGGSGYFVGGSIGNVWLTSTGPDSEFPSVYPQGDYWDGNKVPVASGYFQLPWRLDGKGSGMGCDVVNASGSYGSGAQVKMNLQQSGDYVYLTGFTITSGGFGYTKAYLRITRYYGPDGDFLYRFYYPLECLTGDVSLEVTDSTGSGALLTPVLDSNGSFLSVIVRSGGKGYTNPQIVIHSDSGSGASLQAVTGQSGDYPGAVSYFEQRRWFGGTYQRPNNLWATKSGTESDMSYSLPSQDDDRISVRVAAREANRVLHIVPLQQLMLFTSSTEWRISPLNSDAITPSSMSVRPQSYVGANNVQPVVVNNTAIYAQSRGGHLRECGYSYEAGGFITNDLCLRAPHLFDNLDVVDLAYAKAPWPIIWAVSSSGKLIAFTYVPEQHVGAFSTIETRGEFKSCCVVAEGQEDVLYAVVERQINGKKCCFIERMHERQFTSLNDCVYVDCSGFYYGDAKTEISGLTWLEGEEVSILADGSVEPPQVVKDGKITLSIPANKVHVGLAYTGDLKTLPVAAQFQDGSFGAGHQKNVRSVYFRVVDSGGLKAGPSEDTLAEFPARGIELAGSPPDPLTDEFGFDIAPQWGASGQVCVRQDNPLPLRIISMTTVVEIV